MVLINAPLFLSYVYANGALQIVIIFITGFIITRMQRHRLENLLCKFYGINQ